LAGAGIGALVNVALTAAGDFLDDGEMNMGWEAYAGAAVEGAVTGAAAAATGGASLVVTLAAGAAASGAGNAARQYITTGKVDAKKVVYAAATDVVAGGAGHLASVAVKKVTNSVIKVAASKADDAAKSAKNTISNGVKDSSNKIKTIAASSNIKGTGETLKVKTGPKPAGTGPHNNKIEEVAKLVKDGKVIAGGQKLPEVSIKTPGGVKNSRRPDILVEKPDGTKYGINVGKTAKSGAPIKREAQAINDLEDAGLKMHYVPYKKGK